MNLSRRHFFFSAGAALSAAQATRVMGANDRVRVGMVGLGGRGTAHIGNFSALNTECDIVAVCDVDQAARERAVARISRSSSLKPAAYPDMRQVFADPNVDAVSMPLPNHWHALATIWACQAGKHVYIEKPACHNVFEGWKMVEASRKYKRLVQIGSQSRSMPHKQKAVQLLHEGAIGKVFMAKGLCYKRRKSIGHAADTAVPPGVDWDKFLGPAPMRPFNPLRFRYNWHWFWDTGNGDIGNQGIHEMDMARWGLGCEGLPRDVVSTGVKAAYQDDQETPNTQSATLDYGDARVVFEVRGLPTGGEGGLDASGPSGGKGNIIGNLFYGSDGWMAVNGTSFQVYNADGQKTMDEHGSESDLPHFRNFLDAVRNHDASRLNADVEIGVTSACLVHLANISYRTGKRLAFDPKAMCFPGAPEANRLLTREYRSPYVVPANV